MHKHEKTGSKITWSSAKSASFNMHHPSSIASMTITISEQSIFNRFKNCIANRMSLPAMGANAFTALSAPFPARPKAVSSKRPVRNALRRKGRSWSVGDGRPQASLHCFPSNTVQQKGYHCITSTYRSAFHWPEWWCTSQGHWNECCWNQQMWLSLTMQTKRKL